MERSKIQGQNSDMQRLILLVQNSVIACTVLLLTGASGCRQHKTDVLECTFPAMGTFASVTLAAPDTDRINEANTIATEVLQRVENTCSIFKPESDISRLNASAGTGSVVLSLEAETVLLSAQRHGAISQGAFDITVGRLMKLWGFRGGQPAEPDPACLQAALHDAGWRHISLSNHTARLLRPGTRIDLGGIAKGYGVDKVCEQLLEAGISNALINLGGNIRVLGVAKKDRLWRVAVRNPFEPSKTLGVLSLNPGLAVATSGHYEQFIVMQGRRITHIMDPRSGRPVEGMASVTILAEKAADADALSTAGFVLGLQAIPALLARAQAAGAIIVPDRQPLELWISPGLQKHFIPNADIQQNIKTLTE